MKKKGKEFWIDLLFWVTLVAAAVPLLYAAGRIFVCDRFIIKGYSMEPTLHTGTPVYVNKLILGGRIYTKFDWESDTLHCFRMPGLRKLKVGDIAVYNYQYGTRRDTISFKINYVYAKRCVGCPGDTLSIVNGRYVNSSVADVGVPESLQSRLSATPDSVLFESGGFRAGRFAGEKQRWTIKDFGPILVPGKGIEIQLDSVSRRHYATVLRYETGQAPEKVVGDTYVFKNNYYFFAGDNVMNSRDSRYDGFVPEDFVVGVFKNRKR